MAQYNPITVKSDGSTGRVPTVFGSDTVRADRKALGGLITTGLATGDACQILTKDTATAAVNTTASPIVGIYEGNSGSLVTQGVVAANFAAGPTTVGETVYLSSTAGQLTNVKPTKDYVHEVGVVVDVSSKLVNLQPRFLVHMPDSPLSSLWITGATTRQFLSPAATLVGSVDTQSNPVYCAPLWDGTWIWTANNDNPAKVERYDPVTRARQSLFTKGYMGGNQGSRFCFDGTNYWIPGTGNNVTKFDLGGTTLATVGIGAAPLSCIYDGGGNVIVLRTYTNIVYKISIATNTITGTCTIAASGGSTHGGFVENTTGTRYYWQPYWGPSFPYPMYWAKIRISDMTVVANYSMGYNNDSQPACHDGTYAWTFSGTWVFRFNLSDGALSGSYNTSQPTLRTICYDRGFIWVGKSAGYQFIKMNPATGSFSLIATADYDNIGICSNNYTLPL